MSAYGPALFISRKDKKELDPKEQEKLVSLVKAAAKKLKLKDDEDNAIKPSFYNYGDYEKGGVGVLLYSSYIYSMMPKEVQEDEDNAWKSIGVKLGKEIEKAHAASAGVYKFVCYFVED
jgi:hypothetical protein